MGCVELSEVLVPSRIRRHPLFGFGRFCGFMCPKKLSLLVGWVATSCLTNNHANSKIANSQSKHGEVIAVQYGLASDQRDAIVDLHFQRSPITAATVVGPHFGQIATFDCVWATVAEKRDGQVPSKWKNHGCRKRVVAFIIDML